MPKLRQPISAANQIYELDVNQIEDLPSVLLMDEKFVATWRIFLEMRSRIIKKPLSCYGAGLILNKLVKHADHVKPVEVLERSIENTWQGIFPENMVSEPERGQKRGVIL